MSTFSNTEETEAQDTNGYISVCRDCGFVDVARAEDDEELAMSGEDPAEQHYHETGHAVGSFHVDAFDAETLWEMAR